MRHLAQIIGSNSAAAAIMYRGTVYGASSTREFLRDTLAMANADINGPRHIIVGVRAGADGSKVVEAVGDDDFGPTPGYAQLARKHIEPAIEISYEPSLLDGKQIGVFQINDCRDRPYMMRIDYSETLRRGDAYIRINDTAIKMGRAELQAQFERRFHDSVSADNIEVGFAGNSVQKDLRLVCHDIAELPSTVATRNLEEMMKAQAARKPPGSTSMVARLVHTRLYGTDDPYVSRSPEELMLEMDQIGFKYAEQDRQFLFGSHAQTIQVMIQNHGSEPIINARLLLVLPKDSEFLVANRPPSPAKASSGDATYPTIKSQDNVTRITQKLNDIPAGGAIRVFAEPLRIFAGNALRGRKFGLSYALQGQNLRAPLKGRLRLLFGS
jgi:hypothetical protein